VGGHQWAVLSARGNLEHETRNLERKIFNQKSMHDLSATYWNQRYENEHTPWDIGYASPPLLEYIKWLKDKQIRILIPGAGRAYEAIFLHRAGFEQVWVCDWAPAAFGHLLEHCPEFPRERLLAADFFELDMEFDLMLEQTFFCAIDRAQRQAYARQAAHLLKGGGLLAGVLFAQEFEQEGPPFGGTAAEYQDCFEPHFEILIMEISPHSIRPRAGRELFVEMRAR
jgi:SAM-dependent methyltransferase